MCLNIQKEARIFQLLLMTQGCRSAFDYATEFQMLAAQSGWNDSALNKAVFCRTRIQRGKSFIQD